MAAKKEQKKEHVLSKDERKEFEDIRRKDGKDAAKTYKTDIVAKNPPSGDIKSKHPTARKKQFEDPAANTNAQQKENEATFEDNIEGNRIDQDTVGGSREYYTDPITGERKIKDTLTGPNKDLYDAETGADTMGARLAGKFIDQLPQDSYSSKNIDPRFGIPTADTQDRMRIEGDVYNNLTRDLDQNYKQTQEEKKQELADRGIPLGSELYSREMDRLDKGYQRQKLEARSQATQIGGQELSNQFGMGLQSHQQAIGDLQGDYSLPTSLAGSLLGIGQGYQQPNFIGFQPIEKQGVDFGQNFGIWQGAKTARRGQDIQQQGQTQAAGLDAQKLALARQQAAAGNAAASVPGFGGTTG